MHKVLKIREINPYEKVVYKALNLYFQHQKKPFNICSFSKIGFYIGFLIGIVVSVYITSVIAILIGDFKLEMLRLVLISLGILVGVGGLIFLIASIGSAAGWLLCKCLNSGRRINLKSDERLKEAIKNSKIKHLSLEIPRKKCKSNCTIKHNLNY